MKRSDIGVTAFIYAVTLFFLYMTLDLPPDAQTYPLCLIAGLLGLNTLYLLRCLHQLLRSRSGVVNDLPVIFEGFRWKQFSALCLGCILYMVLLQMLGFYLASTLYLMGTLAFLRVPPLHIGLTVLVMGVMIYVVFTLFLKVPLPGGLLFR